MWWLLASQAQAAPLYTNVVSELTSTSPNVLVILADDIGTDNIRVYGEADDAPRTPNIDALAAQGVRFRNAYANPVCSPTRAALLTGRYARRTGLGAIVGWTDTTELALEEVTLAEFLDEGPFDYSTAAIGKWHLSGPQTPNAFDHPNLQGFDSFAGTIHNLYFEDESQEEKRDGEPSDYFHYDRVVDGVLTRSDRYATRQQTDDALEAIHTLEEPWFVYLAYNAAHSPFQAPPGSELGPRASDVQRYDATIEEMDTQIGRLLDGLESKRQRTIVIFLADNGTPKEVVTAPYLPKHAKATLYEGGTNVPLIVAGPGVTQRGVTTPWSTWSTCSRRSPGSWASPSPPRGHQSTA
jgi:arylsulfatase B